MDRYRPENAPEEIDLRVKSFLRDELSKISASMGQIVDGEYEVLHVAPPKPKRGLVVYADGTNWNPGSGEGLYRHNGSSWVFIG